MSRGVVVQRVRHHLDDPLARNSYLLILGSALTSVIGLVFWIAAARLYDATDVGIASTLIATMGFLANIATLGLRNGLLRFLPAAGTGPGGRAPAMILWAYGVCAAAAALAAVVFLVGQPWWGKGLGILRESHLTEAIFVVATVGWVIFVLQDSVLTGLRLASWVPLENAAYSLAKLGLLVVLASNARWGIFAAWSAPAVAFLLPVNVLVFRRIRAATDGDTPRASLGPAAGLPGLGAIVRFAAGDHVASFLWLGATELLVLVVLTEAGARASAVYYLCFTMAYSLYLVTANVSSAFVVEAASRPDDEPALVLRGVRHSARIVVPAAVIGSIVAPWVLRVFGGVYEERGTLLLRLLLLSAIPQIVVSLVIGRARAHQRVISIVVINAVTAVALFVGTIAGMRTWGLNGVGWTWLVTQLVLAVVLAPALRSGARAPFTA